MDLEKLNVLKQKGNDAFIANRLEEAANFYSEAIVIAKLHEDPILKILFSNRSQTYLKQKKYQLAIEDADESLKLDPSFIKSILRRAVANAELNNRQEAIDGFRQTLKTEPTNPTAISFIRRLLLPSKMNTTLHDAYIAQFLRREVLKLSDPGFLEYSYFSILFKHSLFRQMLLSVNSPKLMQRFLNRLGVSPMRVNVAVLMVPRWFEIRRVKQFSTYYTSFGFELSKKSLKIFLDLVQPMETTLFIGLDFDGFGSLYNYSNVRFMQDWNFLNGSMYKHGVNVIRENSETITHLPYTSEILKFKDTTFSKINTLMVTNGSPVDLEFLKLWKEKQWGVNSIWFKDFIPDLSTFKRFNGIISDKVHRLHFPLETNDKSLLRNANALSSIRGEFDSLKRVFPALSEITGTIVNRYLLKDYNTHVNGHLKKWIKFYIKKFNKKIKPDWCSLKIAIDYLAGMKKVGDSITVDWAYLKRVVDECRQELKDELNYIRLHGASSLKFGLLTVCHYAMIEFKTEHAEFQLALIANCCID